jgi:uncharacterized protein YbjT (DUF2867 family)
MTDPHSTRQAKAHVQAASNMQRMPLAGATGTLGRETVPALAEHYEVTALVRPGSEARLPRTRGTPSSVGLAQVTDVSTLIGVCDGIDTVITTVGITRQRDGLTYDQVDYQANFDMLREAERAGVGRFLFVSVVGADQPSSVPGIAAKHRFEQALVAGGVSWIIVRPSGFFTDLLDVLKMAQRGTVWQFGNGENKITQIDVADLAHIIVSNLALQNAAVNVGDSETLTWNEIAATCFRAIDKRPRVVHLPQWALRVALAVTRLLSHATYGVLSFIGHVQTEDTTTPTVGTRTLEQFLHDHAARGSDEGP